MTKIDDFQRKIHEVEELRRCDRQRGKNYGLTKRSKLIKNLIEVPGIKPGIFFNPTEKIE